jgi:enediyne polyketide synthase
MYPEARSPAELWENVLAQRRAFRRIPSERLRSEDYLDADPQSPDRTYATEAAVIEGYEFDRVAFRVVGSTYRSADLAHWLALDVASRALADAGLPNGDGLDRTTTGVVLGNTLTGEFSRANLMRLRWPYVRRVLDSALDEQDWSAALRAEFLARLEEQYKAPFPPVGEETLAGGLSNTIAGRICNQFDFKGGGYSIDGACASSLLAVANACSSLAAGDLDVALAGGVDLSLDPFEIVGFAKTGALAPELMRVYDARSAGFWPGEGCGFVVLMRHEDAIAQGRRIYASIRGWGISSDGAGGITRPEVDGQIQALRRAYRRAGYGIDTVGYFEGHGTGTSVGDATELQVISRARREARADAPPAAIGSIKANIGHTKAAAGIAGLLKATLAVQTQTLPPTTGCEKPHAEFGGDSPALRVLREPESWPADRPLRASVSAMGFGGMNTHVTLESATTERRRKLTPRERALAASAQDCELFFLAATDAESLLSQVEKLLAIAPRLSRSELIDLAAELASTNRSSRREEALIKSEFEMSLLTSAATNQFRATVLASSPLELAQRLGTLRSWLLDGVAARIDFQEGIFLGSGSVTPRIGFLFPGQGSPAHLDGGIFRRRFDRAREVYDSANLPANSDGISTDVAQPAIATASLCALRVMGELGIEAGVAVGHSLGEITALHWAGAFDEAALLRIARVRGKAMAELGSPTGAMAAIAAPAEAVRELLAEARSAPVPGRSNVRAPEAAGNSVVRSTGHVSAPGDGRTPTVSIVGFNSPRQTVVAGEAQAVHAVAERAQARGWRAVMLPVSHAFHTPLVAAAAPVLAQQLLQERMEAPQRHVVSTVSGAVLRPEEDLRDLLCRQVTSPVKFIEAVTTAAAGVDLFIEVGPGQVLAGLAADSVRVPVVALDAGGPSLKGLLQAAGAAFALGAPVNCAALFEGRFTRSFNLDWKPKFFVNPCELAPVPDRSAPVPGRRNVVASSDRELSEASSTSQPSAPEDGRTPAQTPLELVRTLVAQRAELPVGAIRDDSRMLSDLHLNSITVGQLVAEAAKRLNLPPLIGLTDFANATVGRIAQALEELARSGGAKSGGEKPLTPTGVDSWVRAFTVEWVISQGFKAVQGGNEKSMNRFGTVGDSAARTAAINPAAWDVFRTEHVSGIEEHSSRQAGSWKILASPAHPLVDPLREGFQHAERQGVVVCLPASPDESPLRLLLNGARAVLAMKPPACFVLVQSGGGAAGFAKTLHLESPDTTVCIVDVPFEHPQAAAWVGQEARAAEGFVEVRYDASGQRYEPRWKFLPTDELAGELPIGPADVLLVTGGGKGIAAECALHLARKSGTRLVLLGRSQPSADAELAANLERIQAAGVRCRYVAADVTDAEAVRVALAEAQRELGPVTAFLHAAGTNVPQLIGSLDEAAFRRTLAPKVQGARNVLAALDADRLRLLITFGSIIGRAGLAGEADYAVANEWLTRLTEEFQASHPKCRCLALEWSVWSGVGMGARLGRIETLRQQGITPISPEAGVEMLEQLLRARLPATAVVVTGRFGDLPTLKLEKPDLPFLRFLEQPRVVYPGVELIVDSVLSADNDPYIEDHVYHGERLFPAVMGLEAMAQAAMALAGSQDPPSFEDVTLSRPVVVPRGGKVTMRVAALARSVGEVEVALRSEETGFQVDHFRAVCRFAANRSSGREEALASLTAGMAESAERDQSLLTSAATMEKFRATRVPLDPASDLYEDLLFHSGRFQRVLNYRLLRAKECVVQLDPDTKSTWFGRYLPQDRVLGDTGVRDAAIHAIQACIPHAQLLPVGVKRIVVGKVPCLLEKLKTLERVPELLLHARETKREGDTFYYDLELLGEDGSVLEQWEGLCLRKVADIPRRRPWMPSLLAAHIERRLEEFVPCAGASVVLERGVTGHDAMAQTLGGDVVLRRRADGKPEASNGRAVSAAHAGDWTLAVAAAQAAGCDLESVTARGVEDWRGLLGAERFRLAELLAAKADLDTAATRVWCAVECLKKVGAATDAPLTLVAAGDDGWTVLSSGARVIATYGGAVADGPERLVVGVLVTS